MPNPQVPPEVMAQTIVGALVRLVFWWLETPNEFSAKEMADMLWQAIHSSAMEQ
jgi:hypothetical protein